MTPRNPNKATLTCHLVNFFRLKKCFKTHAPWQRDLPSRPGNLRFVWGQKGLIYSERQRNGVAQTQSFTRRRSLLNFRSSGISGTASAPDLLKLHLTVQQNNHRKSKISSVQKKNGNTYCNNSIICCLVNQFTLINFLGIPASWAGYLAQQVSSCLVSYIAEIA